MTAKTQLARDSQTLPSSRDAKRDYCEVGGF